MSCGVKYVDGLDVSRIEIGRKEVLGFFKGFVYILADFVSPPNNPVHTAENIII